MQYGKQMFPLTTSDCSLPSYEFPRLAVLDDRSKQWGLGCEYRNQRICSVIDICRRLLNIPCSESIQTGMEVELLAHDCPLGLARICLTMGR